MSCACLRTVMWNLLGRRVHVKDLHEAKLVENCNGGNYLQWQSLLLDLTCSIHPDFTWGFNPPLACTPATD